MAIDSLFLTKEEREDDVPAVQLAPKPKTPPPTMQTATSSTPVVSPTPASDAPMPGKGDIYRQYKALADERIKIKYNTITTRSAAQNERLREIEEEMAKVRFQMAGGDKERYQKYTFQEEGVEQSTITPWEWFGGFGVAKTLQNLGRTTLKGAATRGMMTAAPMAATETGAEIAADAVAPDNPWINMAISLGLGLTAGNITEAFIDRNALKLINKKSPNFFSKHLAATLPENTKHVSKQAKARIKALAARIDEGDMVALKEAREIVKKGYYRDAEDKMTLTGGDTAKRVEKSRREVNRDLMKRSFADIEDKDLDEIQKIAEVDSFKGFDQEFSKIRKKVNEKLAMDMIRDHPVTDLIQSINRGGGLNEQRLTHMVGAEAVEGLKAKHPNLIKADGGVDPIHKAVAYGYESVEEMLTDFAHMPDLKQAIRRVNRDTKYDWEVVYYDEFAKRVAGTELNMWEKIGGKKMVNAIRSAVRANKKLAGGGPRTLGAITDETNFIRKVAQKASKAQEGILNKEARITQLAKAAELRTATKEKRAIKKVNDRIRVALQDNNLPEEYQDVIHRYLKPYEDKASLADPDGPSVRNFLDNKVEEGVPMAKLMRQEYEDILELPQMMKKQDITVEQYQKMDRMIMDLRRMGKKQTKLDRLAEGTVVNEYVKKMQDTADTLWQRKYERPSVRDLVTGKRTLRKGWKDRVDKWASELKRPENILREIDGFDDFGEAQKMFRAAKFAEDQNFQISKVLGDKWRGVIADYAKATGKKLNKKFWAKRFSDSKSDFSADREKMLTMAAMTGNTHNKRALLVALSKEEGTPMSETALNRFLQENMTDADWKLVKDTWALTDEMYDMLADTYKRMTGRTLPKVNNYFPIVPDYSASRKAAKRHDLEREDIEDVFMNMPNAYKMPPKVQDRFFKSRVGGTDAIRIDFDAFAKHLRDVSHTVSHWEVTDDLRKVINDPKFRDMVESNLGRHKYTALKQWHQDLIKPAPTDAPTLKRLRINTTTAMLGLKLSTAMVQPLSMISAIPRVGRGNLMVGLARFARHPMEMKKTIDELSEQMAGRNQAFERDIRDLLMSKEGDRFKTMKSSDRNMLFKFIRMGDVLGAYPTWYAGYMKAMKKYKGDQRKAIQYADQSVRLTQPQSTIKDLPKIMRSEKEWQRLITMFYSYYSVLHNQAAELMQKRKVGKATMGEVISGLNYMYVIPPLVKTTIQEQGDVDPATLGAGVATHVAGGLPIARDAVSMLAMGYDPQVTPAADFLKQLGRTATAGKKLITQPDELELTDMGGPLMLAGEVFGNIPSSQIMSMIRGGHAYLNDEDVNLWDVMVKKRKNIKD